MLASSSPASGEHQWFFDDDVAKVAPCRKSDDNPPLTGGSSRETNTGSSLLEFSLSDSSRHGTSRGTGRSTFGGSRWLAESSCSISEGRKPLLPLQLRSPSGRCATSRGRAPKTYGVIVDQGAAAHANTTREAWCHFPRTSKELMNSVAPSPSHGSGFNRRKSEQVRRCPPITVTPAPRMQSATAAENALRALQHVHLPTQLKTTAVPAKLHLERHSVKPLERRGALMVHDNGIAAALARAQLLVRCSLTALDIPVQLKHAFPSGGAWSSWDSSSEFSMSMRSSPARKGVDVDQLEEQPTLEPSPATVHIGAQVFDSTVPLLRSEATSLGRADSGEAAPPKSVRNCAQLKRFGGCMVQSMVRSFPPDVWDACDIPHPDDEEKETRKGSKHDLQEMAGPKKAVIPLKPETINDAEEAVEAQETIALAKESGWSVLDVEEVREHFVQHCTDCQVGLKTPAFEQLLSGLYDAGAGPDVERVRSFIQRVITAHYFVKRRGRPSNPGGSPSNASEVSDEAEDFSEASLNFSEFFFAFTRWLHRSPESLRRNCVLKRFSDAPRSYQDEQCIQDRSRYQHLSVDSDEELERHNEEVEAEEDLIDADSDSDGGEVEGEPGEPESMVDDEGSVINEEVAD